MRVIPVWKDTTVRPTVKLKAVPHNLRGIAETRRDPLGTIGAVGIRVKVPFWTLPSPYSAE